MKYGPIICDPTSEEAKALVGKTVAFSSFYTESKENCDTAWKGKLVKVNKYGFYDVDMHGHTFIREVIEEPPKYRPYKDCEEMIEDFKARFMHKEVHPAFMPLIWVKAETTTELVTAFGEGFLYVCGEWMMLEDIFTEYTYLDGSPVGKEVADDR